MKRDDVRESPAGRPERYTHEGQDQARLQTSKRRSGEAASSSKNEQADARKGKPEEDQKKRNRDQALLGQGSDQKVKEARSAKDAKDEDEEPWEGSRQGSWTAQGGKGKSTASQRTFPIAGGVKGKEGERPEKGKGKGKGKEKSGKSTPLWEEGGDKTTTKSKKEKKQAKKNSCFRCGQEGHMSKDCTVAPKCLHCGGDHLLLHCPEEGAKEKQQARQKAKAKTFIQKPKAESKANT